MLCGNEVVRALHVSVFVHMCVLNVWHCETEQATFAVRDWLRAGHQEQPAVYTRGQRLHVEEKCFTTPGLITFNIYWHSFLSLSIKTTGQQLLFNLFLSFSLCPSIHYPLCPPPHSLSFSPLSSIIPHRLSFLSKPFSHPLLRLVFFPWVSEWREGNGSFEFLMPRMKNVALVISQRYELVNFLQDTTLQVTRWCETIREKGRKTRWSLIGGGGKGHEWRTKASVEKYCSKMWQDNDKVRCSVKALLTTSISKILRQNQNKMKR